MDARSGDAAIGDDAEQPRHCAGDSWRAGQRDSVFDGGGSGLPSERERGKARLEEAAAAFDACLTVTETAWPAEWVQRVRSLRDETRAEITRRRAAK
jgi:hypothetical protein